MSKTGLRRGFVLLLSGAGLLLLLALLVNAQASAVLATCAGVSRDNSGLGTRTWYTGTGNTAGTACSTLTDALVSIGSGESVDLVCRESTTGTPPGAADVTIHGRADNTDFGVVAGAAIWTRTFTGGCTTQQTWTVYCTSDGTATGAPRYGIVRLWLRAQRTQAVAYDTNSDSSGTVGIYHCNPRLSAFSDGNPVDSPETYVGTDTLRTSATGDAAAYNSGANTRLDLVCDTSTIAVGNVEIGLSATTQDQALKGSLTTWPEGCTIQQVLTITRTSAIAGLTSEPYARWDTQNPISGVTYNDVEARRTAKPLVRTLTLGNCARSIGAETNIERVMPGDTVTVACMTLANARGENVAGSTLATGYIRRTSAFSTADFPSADFSTSLGAASWSARARSSEGGGAAATDTNSTQAMDYVAEVKIYSASRLDTEMMGWGNSVSILDVSTTFTLDIHTYRSTCTGTSSAVFVIAAHVLAQQEGPVRDARGNVVTRPLIFNRSWEETDQDARIPSTGYDTTSGVTSGTSPCHTIHPEAPESANWNAQVTVVDGLGSTGTSQTTVSFLSPYTTPYQASILGAAVPGTPCRSMPLQVRILKLNEATSMLEPFAPDAPPYYWVNYTDETGAWQAAQPATTATPTGVSTYAYHANWTVPCSWPLTRAAVLHVGANVSGLFITARADLLVHPPEGKDPLMLSASDVDAGSWWTVIVTSRYDNQTARTGAASNITLRVTGPDGSITFNGNPTEEVGPNGPEGYYYATGLATLEGVYEVRATARTDLNELRNAPAVSFRAMPRPARDANLSYYGPELMALLNLTLSNIQDANNTSSGALSFATFQLRWEEFRGARERLNETTTSSESRAAVNESETSHVAIHRAVEKEGAATRASPGDLARFAPTSPQMLLIASLLLLCFAGCLISLMLGRGRRGRIDALALFLLGLVLSGVYYGVFVQSAAA